MPGGGTSRHLRCLGSRLAQKALFGLVSDKERFGMIEIQTGKMFRERSHYEQFGPLASSTKPNQMNIVPGRTTVNQSCDFSLNHYIIVSMN